VVFPIIHTVNALVSFNFKQLGVRGILSNYVNNINFKLLFQDESKDSKSADLQQKARDVTQEHSESQTKEPGPRPKPETSASHDHVQRIPASRDDDIVQQQDSPNQREEKSTIDSRSLKEAHQKLTEKHNAVLAQLDAQVGAQVRVCFISSRKSTVPRLRV